MLVKLVETLDLFKIHVGIGMGSLMGLRPTFRLGHNHGEETDSSVDVTEPAAVKLEHDGGLGDHSRLFTDPGSGGGSRWTCKDNMNRSL